MRLIVFAILIFVLAACTSGDATDVPRPSIVPLLITSTRAPSVTPTIVITPQPLVNCPQTPPTRLIIQDRGRVSDQNDETLNLRNGPGTSFDILQALDPLDEFIVIDGPTCAGGFSWFRVRHQATIGWIAEGDDEEYYVEPYLTG